MKLKLFSNIYFIAVFSWKLSRTPALTPAANTIINNIISNTQGLLEEYYLPTSQTVEGCFYVPVPVPGQSVLFRAPCGVPTLMENFNANQVSYFWNEIYAGATLLTQGYPTHPKTFFCGMQNVPYGSSPVWGNIWYVGLTRYPLQPHNFHCCHWVWASREHDVTPRRPRGAPDDVDTVECRLGSGPTSAWCRFTPRSHPRGPLSWLAGRTGLLALTLALMLSCSTQYRGHDRFRPNKAHPWLSLPASNKRELGLGAPFPKDIRCKAVLRPLCKPTIDHYLSSCTWVFWLPY